MKTKNKQKGYTLIEIIMSIVLMGIISGIFISTIVEGSRTYAFIESEYEAAFTAKFALKRLLLECRNASLIYSADKPEIDFQNCYGEHIVFKYSGNTITISDNGGADNYPLCENAKYFSFMYFDNQNNQLSVPVDNPSEIQSISISLETEKNGITFPVKGKVYLRTKQK